MTRTTDTLATTSVCTSQISDNIFLAKNTSRRESIPSPCLVSLPSVSITNSSPVTVSCDNTDAIPLEIGEQSVWVSMDTIETVCDTHKLITSIGIRKTITTIHKRRTIKPSTCRPRFTFEAIDVVQGTETFPRSRRAFSPIFPCMTGTTEFKVEPTTSSTTKANILQIDSPT